MKRLLTESEKATLKVNYRDREDRRIIAQIFKTTQDMKEAVKIFNSNNWYILNGNVNFSK